MAGIRVEVRMGAKARVGVGRMSEVGWYWEPELKQRKGSREEDRLQKAYQKLKVINVGRKRSQGGRRPWEGKG